MPTSFVGAGAMASGSAVTSLVVAMPAGYAAGDYALLQFQQTDGSATVTTPSGWTALVSGVNVSSLTLWVFGRKLAGGDPATVTVSTGASGKFQGVIQAHRGIDPTTQVDVAVSTGNSGSPFTVPFPTAPVTPNARRVVLLSTRAATGTFAITISTVDDSVGCRLVEGYVYSAANVGMGSQYVDEPNLGAVNALMSGAGFSQTGGGVTLYAVVTLRPSDTTNMPVTAHRSDLPHGFMRPLLTQAPLRTQGVPIAPWSPAAPRLVVQALLAVSGGYQWQDLSARTRHMDWQRGGEKPADRPRVGTLGLVFTNTDAAMSAWQTSGPFTVGGRSWIRPGLIFRAGLTTVDGWFPFITGRLETNPESFSENVDSWLTITAVESTAGLANDTRVAVGAVGLNETPDVRIPRILDALGWYGWGLDMTDYSDPIGDTFPLLATTLQDSPLAEIYTVADSCLRRAFARPDGSLHFGRLYPDPSAPMTQVFGNVPVPLIILPLVDVVPYSSTDRILNLARGTWVGHTPELTRFDAGSIAQYDRMANNYGLPRQDFVVNDGSDLGAVLQAMVDRHAYDELGFESFTVDADQSQDLWTVLATLASSGLETHQHTGIQFTHPSGAVLSFEGMVDGFTFGMDPAGDQAKWTGTVALEVFTAPTS